MSNTEERNIAFEIVEHYGVITEHPTGWNKEVNLVSWNGGAPKYDIRDWDSEHEHMSRGITVHKKEMQKLTELLKGDNSF